MRGAFYLLVTEYDLSTSGGPPVRSFALFLTSAFHLPLGSGL